MGRIRRYSGGQFLALPDKRLYDGVSIFCYSLLLRLLTGNDMKGVPVLFMKAQRTVLFLPINERAHKTLSLFTGRSSENIETEVLLMGKGKPPPGLAEAMERLKASKTRTLGVMSADISIIEKSGNKLMEELRAQIASMPNFSMNIDVTELALDILSFIPSGYHSLLRAASQEALSCYGKVYNALEKTFGVVVAWSPSGERC